MARIVKEEEYTGKRNAILDVAQRLIYSRGYEQMTIQDMLDDLQISKGAFYHYFDSKQAVLEALVERMGEEALQLLVPIVHDPALPALDKFQRYLAVANRWKVGQKAFFLALLRVWFTDDNAVVRQKLRAIGIREIAPLLAEILCQGVQEGVMRVSHPDQMGEVIASLVQDAGEALGALLISFDPPRAALRFETSGTTNGTPGVHYMETARLYDAALLAAFDRFMLADGARLRYLHLLPEPAQRGVSSLGYMLALVSEARGESAARWYVRAQQLQFDAFAADLRAACAEGAAVCIAATAFALASAIQQFARDGVRFGLPRGSRIMETGGFKGRTRTVSREQLYAGVARCFGIESQNIVAEYGMTELTSQYYDAPETRTQRTRVKASPPWLRPRVVGPDGRTPPHGTAGGLVHVDLANRSSCIAIATEDTGARTAGGFVLFGRKAEAELRGCSLDSEALAASR